MCNLAGVICACAVCQGRAILTITTASALTTAQKLTSKLKNPMNFKKEVYRDCIKRKGDKIEIT